MTNELDSSFANPIVTKIKGHNATIAEILKYVAGETKIGSAPSNKDSTKEQINACALLFSGPKGIGKATLAIDLAAHILAMHNKCYASAQVRLQCLAGSYPNLVYLGGQKVDDQKKDTIAVATVRDLIARLAHHPALSGPKIIIIDSIDLINNHGANALLKILEEPPAQTFFFIINHQLERVLPTIRSRLQLITFKKLSNQILANLLGPTDDKVVALANGSAGLLHYLNYLRGCDLLKPLEDLIYNRAHLNLSETKMLIQKIVKALENKALENKALENKAQKIKTKQLSGATKAAKVSVGDPPSLGSSYGEMADIGAATNAAQLNYNFFNDNEQLIAVVRNLIYRQAVAPHPHNNSLNFSNVSKNHEALQFLNANVSANLDLTNYLMGALS